MISSIFLILSLIIVVSLFWVTIDFDKRCQRTLKKWAKENNYELVKYEGRNFGRPFPVFSLRQEWRLIYYFEIRNQEGQIKTGWMRFREGLGRFNEPNKRTQIDLVWD